MGEGVTLNSVDRCWAASCQGPARQTPVVLETPAPASYLFSPQSMQIGHLQVPEPLDSGTQLWTCKAGGTMEIEALGHFQTIHTLSPPPTSQSPTPSSYQADQWPPNHELTWLLYLPDKELPMLGTYFHLSPCCAKGKCD